MAADPVKGYITDPQSMVQYTYCLNNPIRFVDPLGLVPVLVPGAKIGTGVGDNTINNVYFDIDTGSVYVNFFESLDAFGLTKDKGYKVTPEGYVIFSAFRSLQATLTNTVDSNETFFSSVVTWRLNDLPYIETGAIMIPYYAQSTELFLDTRYFFRVMCLLEYNGIDMRVNPLSNYSFSCGFGCDSSKHPIIKHSGNHIGQDFKAKSGENPVYAAIYGNVKVKRSIYSGAPKKEPEGIYMEVASFDGRIVTSYKHLSKIIVTGGSVHAGQLIAEMGNTGNSSGKHLHFDVKIDGTYVDPIKFLRYEV